MFRDEETQKGLFFESFSKETIKRREFSTNRLVEVKSFVILNNNQNSESMMSILGIGLAGVFLFYILKNKR